MGQPPGRTLDPGHRPVQEHERDGEIEDVGLGLRGVEDQGGREAGRRDNQHSGPPGEKPARQWHEEQQPGDACQEREGAQGQLVHAEELRRKLLRPEEERRGSLVVIEGTQ